MIEGDRGCFTECEGRGVNNQLVDRQPWLCQVAGWAPATSEHGSPFRKRQSVDPSWQHSVLEIGVLVLHSIAVSSDDDRPPWCIDRSNRRVTKSSSRQWAPTSLSVRSVETTNEPASQRAATIWKHEASAVPVDRQIATQLIGEVIWELSFYEGYLRFSSR